MWTSLGFWTGLYHVYAIGARTASFAIINVDQNTDDLLAGNTELETTTTSNGDSDCVYSDWSDWSKCPCGIHSSQTRTRKSIGEQTSGCVDLTELRPCIGRICNPCVDGLPSNNMELACNLSASTCKFEESNSPYNYSCQCFSGYSYNPTDAQLAAGCYDCCEDIDECQDSSLNLCSDICLNGFAVPQNYTCGCNHLRYPSAKNLDPLTHEMRECETCEYSNWTSWTPCSVKCGSGIMTRQKLPINDASEHPAECPTQSEEDLCIITDCDSSKCEYSSWSDWSKCDADCAGGGQSDNGSVGRRERQKYLVKGDASVCSSTIYDYQPCVNNSCGSSQRSKLVILAEILGIVVGSFVALGLMLLAWQRYRQRASEWDYEDPS